jgi:PhnB protein
MIAPVLAVKDVDASVAFYTEKLGFLKMFMMEGLDGKNSFAFVSMGEQAQIGLDAQPAPQPVGNGVVFMIYVPKEVDIDTLYADVQRHGVTIEQPLRDEYWGDRTFSVKDLDGYYLQFATVVNYVSAAEVADIMKKGSTQA